MTQYEAWGAQERIRKARERVIAAAKKWSLDNTGDYPGSELHAAVQELEKAETKSADHQRSVNKGM